MEFSLACGVAAAGPRLPRRQPAGCLEESGEQGVQGPMSNFCFSWGPLCCYGGEAVFRILVWCTRICTGLCTLPYLLIQVCLLKKKRSLAEMQRWVVDVQSN